VGLTLSHSLRVGDRRGCGSLNLEGCNGGPRSACSFCRGGEVTVKKTEGGGSRKNIKGPQVGGGYMERRRSTWKPIGV